MYEPRQVRNLVKTEKCHGPKRFRLIEVLLYIIFNSFTGFKMITLISIVIIAYHSLIARFLIMLYVDREKH